MDKALIKQDVNITYIQNELGLRKPGVLRKETVDGAQIVQILFLGLIDDYWPEYIVQRAVL